MKNALVMNPEKCPGCHSCEMICSLTPKKGNMRSRDAPAEDFRAWLGDRGVSQEALDRIFPRPGYFNIARMTP
jgi:Fe-S-cluster-containing hydrogenase component 2